jgi:hypothetical protein
MAGICVGRISICPESTINPNEVEILKRYP